MSTELISGVLDESRLGVRDLRGAGRSSVGGDELEKILGNCFPSPTIYHYDRAFYPDVESDDEDDCDDYFSVGPVYDSEVVGRVDEKKYGDTTCDVISLLSWSPEGTPSRNFLITPDGCEVDIMSLRGKHVVVCCVFLPLHNLFHDYSVAGLITILDAAAAPDCPFQLVIVPKVRPCFDPKRVMDHFSTALPPNCLLLPYDDSISCDHACIFLGLSGDTSLDLLIVDPKGTVLQTSLECFYDLGKDAFPFTNQHWHSFEASRDLLICRLDDILFETQGARILSGKKRIPNHAPTLDELLFCHPSQHLPSATDGNVSVSVSDLNEGYVGLYLFRFGLSTELISQLHHQCRARGLPFEILIIPLPFIDPPPFFWNNFRLHLSKYNISSWWLFPYDDRVCRHLWRLSHYAMYDQMIILPPRGSGLSGELQGDAVMDHFGVDAYPFTRASIVERKLNRLGHLTLEDLLPNDCSIFGCEKHPLSVPRLQGKEVFIYLDPNTNPPCSKLLSSLYKIHDAHPDSVLVYVPPKSSKDDVGFDHPPWQVSRSRVTDVIPILFGLAKDVFRGCPGTIVAVKNGRISSLYAHSYHTFKFDNYLRTEILTDLLSELYYLYD